MATRRWLLTGLVAVAVAECLVWFFGASTVWSTRDILVGSGSAQAAGNTRFALVIYAGTGINVVALIFFLVRRRGRGWWLLTAVQIGDLAVSSVEAVVRSTTWWLLAGLAALTLTLLYLFRRST